MNGERQKVVALPTIPEPSAKGYCPTCKEECVRSKLITDRWYCGHCCRYIPHERVLWG